MPPETIAVIDFGSQYTQLIARRLRELNVYSEIHPCDEPVDQWAGDHIRGCILTGGPASTYREESPSCPEDVFELDVPVLGICYGMQTGCQQLGGEVTAAESREYGGHVMHVRDHNKLFRALPDEITVWMSHGDQVTGLTSDFRVLARTDNTELAAVAHKEKPFWGVQFHPEVTHTPEGKQILENFIYVICGCEGDWKTRNYITNTVKEIREEVGDAGVVCGISGGVDSSVTSRLVDRAIGEQLTCIFVDNGLLRKKEADMVRRTFREHLDMNLVFVDETDRFLSALEGVRDPEKKRKIIGNEFVEVFKREAENLDNVQYLAQGTLYPDVIESTPAHGGPTETIKSHHNVGGLPDTLNLNLIEPLRFLFKDEVREIGRELKLPEEITQRQPFPGPGLAVRIPGNITPDRLEILREADAIITEELEKSGEWKDLWQYFGVLLPIQTVGVMGDERTYEHVIAIRAVDSVDGMTADWGRIDENVLADISSRVMNEVRGVNRVVYDISTKPPATIEWE